MPLTAMRPILDYVPDQMNCNHKQSLQLSNASLSVYRRVITQSREGGATPAIPINYHFHSTETPLQERGSKFEYTITFTLTTVHPIPHHSIHRRYYSKTFHRSSTHPNQYHLQFRWIGCPSRIRQVNPHQAEPYSLTR